MRRGSAAGHRRITQDLRAAALPGSTLEMVSREAVVDYLDSLQGLLGTGFLSEERRTVLKAFVKRIVKDGDKVRPLHAADSAGCGNYRADFGFCPAWWR